MINLEGLSNNLGRIMKNQTQSWIDYFMQSNDLLLLELEAVKVYEAVVKEISEKAEVKDFQEARRLLYQKLEERLDNSNDDFERLIIAYLFKSGIYFMIYGLNTVGKLDIYKGKDGKRLNEFSKIVIENAIKLSNQLIENKTQYRLARSILELAIEKKWNNEIQENIVAWVQNIELDLSDEKLAVFQFEFLVPALNYLLSSNFEEKNQLLSKIDNLLEFSKSQKDTAKSVRSQYNEMGFDCIFPQAFGLKIKYYQKLNDKTQEKNTKLELAQFYEQLGFERLETENRQDMQVAAMHFEKAVEIFSKNGFQVELKRAKQKLDAIKERMNELGTGILSEREINLENYLTKDLKQQQEKFLDSFNQLNFDDKIFSLIQMVQFINQSDIEKFRKDKKLKNQFSEMFPTEITNSYKQTIFRDDSDEAKESLALYEYIQYYIFSLAPFIESLMTEVTLDENAKIEFSINGLPNTIKSREHFINKAFELFFSGDIYSGIYILVPQIEHWFREEVYARGGQTSNLRYFPTEQAKTLTPIFESDELVKFLDERGSNVSWLFNQLMTKEPMNLRNKVAHGLEINDNGYCVYYLLVVLKLFLGSTDK